MNDTSSEQQDSTWLDRAFEKFVRFIEGWDEGFWLIVAVVVIAIYVLSGTVFPSDWNTGPRWTDLYIAAIGFVLGHLFWTHAEPGNWFGAKAVRKTSEKSSSGISSFFIWIHDHTYAPLYKKFGGRPWTRISQDSIESKQAAWIFGTAAATIALEWIWGARSTDILALSFGMILGRVFWTSGGATTRRDRTGEAAH